MGAIRYRQCSVVKGSNASVLIWPKHYSIHVDRDAGQGGATLRGTASDLHPGLLVAGSAVRLRTRLSQGMGPSQLGAICDAEIPPE